MDGSFTVRQDDSSMHEAKESPEGSHESLVMRKLIPQI